MLWSCRGALLYYVVWVIDGCLMVGLVVSVRRVELMTYM